MGYTPMIIIDHNELANKVSELEDMSMMGYAIDDPNEQIIFENLIALAKCEPFTFKDHYLTTLTSDLSGRIARYRDILDELGVYYSLDY